MRAALTVCRRIRVDTVLIVLEALVAPATSELTALGRLIGGGVRGADLVGELGPGRLGMLLLGSDAAGAAAMLHRLAARVVDEQSPLLDTFGARVAVSLAREPLDLELLLRAAAANPATRLGALLPPA